MSILGAVAVPHPPIILPPLGRGHEEETAKTKAAYREAAAQAARWKPDVLVITSPHTICYGNYFHISPGERATGSLAQFGASDRRYSVSYDDTLRSEIIRQAEAAGITAGTLGERNPALDHGVMVPLHFLQEAGLDCPVVRMALSGFPAAEHYRLGQCIARAAEKTGQRVVMVASGDLSHKLAKNGIYGFAPEGAQLDKLVTDCFAKGDFLPLLTMDPSFRAKAMDCGVPSFQIMMGALDGLAITPHLYSYECPYGVGYGVASFAVTGRDDSRQFLAPALKAMQERLEKIKAAEDPWVRLARLAVETAITEGKLLETMPEDLPAEMTTRAAGVFVSLHRQGVLRGCIGTTAPTCTCIAREIVRNAVSAAIRDPRFDPVSAAELDALEYSVDVLEEPEPISSMDELDVKKYGVIVSYEGRQGLLLPDLDEVETVEQQVAIACQKGDIGVHDPFTLERFEVVRHR